MASFDEIKQQAEKVAGVAKEKATEFTEAASEWASQERPGLDKAFESVSGVAAGAVDKVAGGADAVYEALKNKAEEISGKDVDGDGLVGATGAAPGEVKAGAQAAAEAVAGAAGAAAGFAKGAFDKLTKKGDDAADAGEAAEGSIVDSIIGAVASAAGAAAGAGEAAAEVAEAEVAEVAEEAAKPVTGWRSATAAAEE